MKLVRQSIRLVLGTYEPSVEDVVELFVLAMIGVMVSFVATVMV